MWLTSYDRTINKSTLFKNKFITNLYITLVSLYIWVIKFCKSNVTYLRLTYCIEFLLTYLVTVLKFENRENLIITMEEVEDFGNGFSNGSLAWNIVIKVQFIRNYLVYQSCVVMMTRVEVEDLWIRKDLGILKHSQKWTT